jgi:hypothetical protein
MYLDGSTLKGLGISKVSRLSSWIQKGMEIMLSRGG